MLLQHSVITERFALSVLHTAVPHCGVTLASLITSEHTLITSASCYCYFLAHLCLYGFIKMSLGYQTEETPWKHSTVSAPDFYNPPKHPGACEWRLSASVTNLKKPNDILFCTDFFLYSLILTNCDLLQFWVLLQYSLGEKYPC